jgi:hypothetical protein
MWDSEEMLAVFLMQVVGPNVSAIPTVSLLTLLNK